MGRRLVLLGFSGWVIGSYCCSTHQPYIVLGLASRVLCPHMGAGGGVVGPTGGLGGGGGGPHGGGGSGHEGWLLCAGGVKRYSGYGVYGFGAVPDVGWVWGVGFQGCMQTVGGKEHRGGRPTLLQPGFDTGTGRNTTLALDATPHCTPQVNPNPQTCGLYPSHKPLQPLTPATNPCSLLPQPWPTFNPSLSLSPRPHLNLKTPASSLDPASASKPQPPL